MNKEEFDIQLKAASFNKADAEAKETQLDAISESIRARVETVVDNVKNRDAKYSEYIDMVSRFNFTGKNNVSSDIFPGIHTSVNDFDPDELAEASSKMTNLAVECEALTVAINQQINTLKEDIKNLYNAFDGFTTIYEGIYLAQTNVLETLNSIYDVGSLYRGK